MNAGDCLALLACLLGWHHVCGTQWNQTTSLLVGYCFFPTATHVKIMWRLEDKNVFILFLIIFNRTRVLRPCTSPIVPAKEKEIKACFHFPSRKREKVFTHVVFSLAASRIFLGCAECLSSFPEKEKTKQGDYDYTRGRKKAFKSLFWKKERINGFLPQGNEEKEEKSD